MCVCGGVFFFFFLGGGGGGYVGEVPLYCIKYRWGLDGERKMGIFQSAKGRGKNIDHHCLHPFAEWTNVRDSGRPEKTDYFPPNIR